jgi:acetyl esterase/lipase
LGITVLNADYRLAPEHRFPTAINDAYDVAKWVCQMFRLLSIIPTAVLITRCFQAAANASSFGADPTKGFIISGSSAGGCLATVTTLRFRDEAHSPPITALHLMIPLLCYPPALPEEYKAEDYAITQNIDAPILNKEGMKWTFDHYIPNEQDRYGPLFSPFLWPTGFKGFPKTYFQIAGMDALRDQDLIFERKLRVDEGVETKVDIYQGVPHGFNSFVPKLKVSAKFVDDWKAGYEWLLKA